RRHDRRADGRPNRRRPPAHLRAASPRRRGEAPARLLDRGPRRRRAHPDRVAPRTAPRLGARDLAHGRPRPLHRDAPLRDTGPAARIRRSPRPAASRERAGFPRTSPRARRRDHPLPPARGPALPVAVTRSASEPWTWARRAYPRPAEPAWP